MLPSQISRTDHFESRRSLSISEWEDFHSLSKRKTVRIKTIEINSSFMLRPVETGVLPTPNELSAYFSRR
jgi:hypothetical protein